MVVYVYLIRKRLVIMKNGLNEILLNTVVVAVVIMMIIPIPVALLDILIAINIALGFSILMLTLYVKKPLDLSFFPSMLLFTTLFRLALNISATRHILLHAYAGQFVASFGDFVVGGNYVVGGVIFILLLVVQNAVIIGSSRRVAEVAAGFTPEAMAGRHMMVEAELAGRLITEKQAGAMHKQLQKEADFYGAMDGVSRFIKGDALASILIICVNMIAGYVIGVLQLGLPFGKVVGLYVLLTVGMGIVSQLPALLIATATGVVAGRGRAEAAGDVWSKILAYPGALYIVSALMFFFVFVPGLPGFPFLFMSFFIGFLTYSSGRKKMEGFSLPELAEEAPVTLLSKEKVLSLVPEHVPVGRNIDRESEYAGYAIGQTPFRGDNPVLRVSSSQYKVRGRKYSLRGK